MRNRFRPAEMRAIPDASFPELVRRAVAVHRLPWDPPRLQLCTLDSPRTGAQALAFLCGANSIFTGEKLLTTPGCGSDSERILLKALGLRTDPETTEPGGRLTREAPP